MCPEWAFLWIYKLRFNYDWHGGNYSALSAYLSLRYWAYNQWGVYYLHYKHVWYWTYTTLKRYTWKASIEYFSYTGTNLHNFMHALSLAILGNLLLNANIWSAARISTKVQHYFWIESILSIQLHIWLTVVSRLLT